MTKYSRLKKEFEALEEKYKSLFAEKSELQYELAACMARQEQLHAQDAEVRALHQSMRRLKHDMKNHFMVLGAHLNAEEYQEAKAYTSEILDKLNGVHTYVETGNLLLNHIVNEKFEHAREKGILIKAEIENLSFEQMKSIDFSALLSNMLDNAIEASQRETEILPEIFVHIFRKGGYQIISVKNRISSSVLSQNPELHSTKEEAKLHGMGIQQIEEIVTGYQGMCDFYEEGDFFCACAFIPQ